MGIWQLDTRSIEDGVHYALLATERVKLLDGWRHHEMGIQNFIWITLSWAEKPRTERRPILVGRVSSILVGRFLEGSLVDLTRTVQRYSVSMDFWKACERRDHERRANFGCEIPVRMCRSVLKA